MQVRDAGQQPDSHRNHTKPTQELMAEGNRPGESRTQPRQLAYSPDAPPRAGSPTVPLPSERDRDPRPTARLSCSAFAGCWRLEGLFLHPADAVAAGGPAPGQRSGGCPRAEPVTGCPSSSFTSPPLFAHHREVTPTTSTYCSHLKGMLLNNNSSTQRLFNLVNFCIYL